MAPTKVAAVQASPVPFNLQASLKRLCELVETASDEGAQLVVFPEAFLSCYPRFLGFRIGMRTDDDREAFAQYVKSSVRIPDGAEGVDWLGDREIHEEDPFAAFSVLLIVARKHKVFLSVGIIERSLVGSTLWCSTLLISPEGILLSKHRKLQPTAAERVVWSQGHARNPCSVTGSTDNLPVVQTSIGKIGGLICWEHYMALPRVALYEKGIEIWTAPTADGRDTWAPTCQHIAQEGRVFLISANQYQTSSDFDASYAGHASEQASAKVWTRGGSCIIDPLGRFLAGPLWDEAGILYATIDVEKLDGFKLDFDPVGHYARTDIFSLVVKE